MTLRREVLSFYKQILRLSKNWKAINECNDIKEQQYIRNEGKRLIVQNKHLMDETEIKKLLDEGLKRLEVAKHYRIPYPRPVYYPTGAYVKRRH